MGTQDPASGAPRGRAGNPFIEPAGDALVDGTGTEPEPSLAGVHAPVRGGGRDGEGPRETEPQPPEFGRWEVEVDGHPVQVMEMAPYDFANPPHEPHDLVISLAPDEGGQWRAKVSWPAWSGAGMAVFRVIAADGNPPESVADNLEATLALTTHRSIVDATTVNPPSSGARFYEVWAYPGDDVASAVSTPPYLYAGGGTRHRVVWPPLALTVEPQVNQLVLSWEQIEGQQFRIARRRQAEARLGRPTPADCTDLPIPGTVDSNAVQGEVYVYYVYAGVHDGEVTDWSDQPAWTKAQLPVRLEAVMDLHLEQRGEALIDLLWSTKQVGDVHIYLSETAPPPEVVTAGQVTFEELSRHPYNLELGRRLTNPVIQGADGTSRMRNVDVSQGEAAVFFTPITRHGADARPGQPESWLRADPPSDLVLVDRVENVLVAFRWPRGAARVYLWRTPVESPPPDPAKVNSFTSLGREDYDTYGGFLVRRDTRFTSGPCALHLAGFTHLGKQSHFSAVATVKGDFPVLVRYWVEPERRGRLGQRSRRRVILQSMENITDAQFHLVRSPRGLPLVRAAGTVVMSWKLSLPARQRVELELDQGIDLTGSGFLRILADPLHEPAIALLDPPLDQLRLTDG